MVSGPLSSVDLSKTAGVLDAALDSMPAYAREMLAGGVAGVVAKTAVAPLGRAQHFRVEGFAGLFRGNGAKALRVFPSKAIQFMAYDRYRSWLLAAAPSLGAGTVVDLLAGSAAGGTALLATYPLNLAGARLACGAAGAVGVSGVLRGAYAEGGVRGLYRGLCPSLARALPKSGIKFCVYESLKQRLPEEYGGRADAQMACAVAAGQAAKTATYPLGVVRRRMQVGDAAVTGAWQGIRAIARAQGVRQLYAGLGLACVKEVPSLAVGLVAYDQMKVLMKLPATAVGE